MLYTILAIAFWCGLVYLRVDSKTKHSELTDKQRKMYTIICAIAAVWFSNLATWRMVKWLAIIAASIILVQAIRDYRHRSKRHVALTRQQFCSYVAISISAVVVIAHMLRTALLG